MGHFVTSSYGWVNAWPYMVPKGQGGAERVASQRTAIKFSARLAPVGGTAWALMHTCGRVQNPDPEQVLLVHACSAPIINR